MDDTSSQIEKANRLSVIAERIGFAIWQFQELEGACATYLVLCSEASPGMGLEAGLELERAAQNRTFGRLLAGMKQNNLLGPELEGRFDRILGERNWLIHRSRADSRSAVHNDPDAMKAIERIDAIAKESLVLLHVIGEKISEYVERAGVPPADIHRASQELISNWQKPDET